MKKISKYLVIIFLCFIFSIICVNAKSYTKDLFRYSDNLIVDEKLEGTAFLSGNSVNIEETIDGIGFIAGNDIKVSNDQKYLFLLGANITLNSNIEKDIFIAGETVDANATINRDSYVFGTTITLNGNYNRNTYIYGTSVELNGTYNGNIYISALNIKIDENAVINGTIKYNKDAIIEGLNDSVKTKTYEANSTISFKDYVINFITSYLHIAILAVVIVFINEKVFKKSLEQTKDLKAKNIAILCGKGFLILIGVPIISFMLILSDLFISVGVIAAIIYGIIIYISNIFTAYFIANAIDKKYLHKNMNTYLLVVVGLLIVYLLKLIPIIGGLISFICTLLGIGILGNMLIELKK